MPANTIEEAQKYFADVLGLTSNDYTAMHLDVANMINKEAKAIYDTFGNVNAGGYLKGVRITSRLSLNTVAAYSLSDKVVLLKEESVIYVTSVSKMGIDAHENFEKGLWSTNNPEHAVRHELGHAVGYWLTEANAVKRNNILVLRNQLLKDSGIDVWDRFRNTKEQKIAAGRLISYYALMNDKELIAESVAEYMTGKPREVAGNVVKTLLKTEGV